MRAMVFDGPGRPLRPEDRPVPRPQPGQLLIRVHACAVCRTDLHLLDGEVDVPKPPRVLGHQIVGTVEAVGGSGAESEQGGSVRGESAWGDLLGKRVGVPWLGWTCGQCEMCRSGRENLCPRARFTGRDIDGGMAQYAVADARFCFALADDHPDEQAAPLLCAGMIGHRALRMCGQARRIGLYGFGSSAHVIAQVAVWQGRSVFAFTRNGDTAAQELARELGASWAGGSDQAPPERLDAAIVFAPVGALVPLALSAVGPAGTVVCAGIHMSDVPSFPYRLLWEERVLRSVANLTRRDGEELLALARKVPIRTRTTSYPLERANEALADLRAGRFTGAAVLVG